MGVVGHDAGNVRLQALVKVHCQQLLCVGGHGGIVCLRLLVSVGQGLQCLGHAVVAGTGGRFGRGRAVQPGLQLLALVLQALARRQ